VLDAERLHGDDTRMPALARGKTDTGRIWVYVRDDKPFGGQAPPSAVFYYSRDRAGEHPQSYLATSVSSRPMPIAAMASSTSPAARLDRFWKRPAGSTPGVPFFVMADLAENARRKAQGKKPAVISPPALETVRRIDALFEIEWAINGQNPEKRKAVRQKLGALLVADLEAGMREQRAKLSCGNDIAKAMDYMLKDRVHALP
jgi:transposase